MTSYCHTEATLGSSLLAVCYRSALLPESLLNPRHLPGWQDSSSFCNLTINLPVSQVS